MEKKASATARAIAAIALVGGVIVILLVVGSSLGGDSGGGERGTGTTSGHVKPQKKESGQAPKVYVVEYGDTLISIAHRTGVPVAKIERLNPEVDPQVLVAGEKLKLR